MKLSDLAKKASELPDLDFEWTGPEHFHDDSFARATDTPDKLRAYVDELRKKMATMSMAIHETVEAYRKMRDIMLEAEVRR